MMRLVLAGVLTGVGAALLFREGLGFLLFHHAALLDPLLGGIRPPAPAFSLRLVAPLGLPEVLGVAAWGGIWGAALASLLRLTSLPDLLGGFLFGAAMPTLLGFVPGTGLLGAPFLSDGFLQGWLRAALVNGAWGWGAACLLRAALPMPARRRPPPAPAR